MGDRKPPLILLGSRAGAGQSGSRGAGSFDAASLEWREAEWLGDPALYEGVFSRRVIAYFLDALLAIVLCLVPLRLMKGVLITLQYANKAAEGRLDRGDGN